MGKTESDEIELLLADGFAHHRAGDLVAAQRRYREVLARRPDDASALHLLGVSCYQSGEVAEALELLEHACRLSAGAGAPGAAPVLRDRGIVLLAAGQPLEAADSFRAALALEPENVETAFNLGVAERHAGRLGDALPLLRAAARALDDSANVHHELGLALEQSGEAGEAIAAYRRALEREPGHGPARAALDGLSRGLAPPPPSADAAELRLCVGTPCFGGNVTDHYTISLLGLQVACIRRGIKLSFCLLHGDALITRARNSVVAEFLRDPRASHLLFIDADIGFSPDQVFRLLESGHDMVGGAYPVKTVHWDRLGPGVAPASTFDYVAELLEPGAPPPADGFARARYVGTGFLLIRRTVFERMAARYPEIKYLRTHASADSDIDPDRLHAYFDCLIDRESGLYLSEDFTFCKRWIDMGGELWVDLRSRLSHVGRHIFAGDYGRSGG